MTIEQLKKEYKKPEDRECFQCGNEIPYEDVEQGRILIQEATGRPFCSWDCIDEYKAMEGLA